MRDPQVGECWHVQIWQRIRWVRMNVSVVAQYYVPDVGWIVRPLTSSATIAVSWYHIRFHNKLEEKG